MSIEKIEKILIKELFEKSVAENCIPEFHPDNVTKLAGDASTRRYYRVTNGDITKSYVVCLDEVKEVGQKHSFLEMQRILDLNNVRVPKIFASYLERGFLLQEDLGDTTFLKRLSDCDNKEEEYKLYLEAINLLISIQSVNIHDPKYKEAPFQNLYFDQSKLMQEVNFTKEYFLKNFLSHNLTKEQEKIIESEYLNICRVLGQKKMCLTHRDYHSRNLMCLDDELICIDFQDARQGVPQYDLVSILEDCYYQIGEENKSKLIKHYYENLIDGPMKSKLDQSADEFKYLYHLMSIQRIYKAIGSFSYIHKTRGDIRYIKYIGYSFERLKFHLSELDECKKLRKVLTQIYYEY